MTARLPTLLSVAVETGPSGNVTFLFTDIEGSTVRWERNAEAMSQALRRHDALLRECIHANRGHVFKTIGDAFCAVFRAPSDALAAALAAQYALVAQDFSAIGGLAVRMALHCGTAEERDGDYFGAPVNRVARLLAITHGGQVVLSEIAARSVRTSLAGLELRDVGAHRLKDLIEPERVFQVVTPDLRAEFPPLASGGAYVTNLPEQLTTLIDREAELATVEKLLEAGRLATLVGAGGIGKTRVALAAGARLREAFAAGVWFVDLAPRSSDEHVVAEVAAVFGIREQNGSTLEHSVLAYLQRKKALLIFDNCEHLIAEAARVAGSILRECPQISILAASREALGIAGEKICRLSSLSVPPAELTLSAQAALEYAAVLLFSERAAAVNRDFRVTDINAGTIGDIVRRLDGIALAIELAAARMSALTPAQLAEKLSERFRLLTGGNRGALPRQQTMRAAIAWSYDLLDAQEQKLFRQVTIFSNGWTLEAASAMFQAPENAGGDIVDMLSALVDKSLVIFDLQDPPRYRLLESIRQYGFERLQEAGEVAGAAERHALHFSSFAREVDGVWDVTPDLQWFARVELELENFRAALEWTLGSQNLPLVGAELAASLRPFWTVKAPVEGRCWLVLAQKIVAAADEPQLAAAIELGLTATAPVRVPALLVGLEKALAIYRRLNDDRGLGRALIFYGDTLAWLGQFEQGENALSEALGIHRRRGDQQLVGVDLCAMGVLERIRGRLSRARELFTSSLKIFEAVESTRGKAAVLANLADLELALGEARRSIRLATDAQTAYRLLRDHARVAQLDCSLAGYHLALERYDDALTYARLALQPLRDVQDASLLAVALFYVAIAAVLGADVARGARLFAYVQEQFRFDVRARDLIERSLYDRMSKLLDERSSRAERATFTAEGEAFSADRAIQEAMR